MLRADVDAAPPYARAVRRAASRGQTAPTLKHYEVILRLIMKEVLIMNLGGVLNALGLLMVDS